MNAPQIVDILIEADVDDFVGSLPPETWETFHIIDGHGHNIRHSDGFEDHLIVYRNNADSTRAFIGYIAQMNDDTWRPTGIARPHPGMPTRVDKVTVDRRSPTKEEAARQLSAWYKLKNK